MCQVPSSTLVDLAEGGLRAASHTSALRSIVDRLGSTLAKHTLDTFLEQAMLWAVRDAHAPWPLPSAPSAPRFMVGNERRSMILAVTAT
jgi:hypothetical protein